MVVSGIPVGATLSDGTHPPFTASTGNTSTDILGWNYANLAVTPYSQAVAPLNPNGTTITTNTDSRITKAAEADNTLVAAHTVAGEASALLHVMALDTKDLEQTLERIRAVDGISRTVTEVVLSTLFAR